MNYTQKITIQDQAGFDLTFELESDSAEGATLTVQIEDGEQVSLDLSDTAVRSQVARLASFLNGACEDGMAAGRNIAIRTGSERAAAVSYPNGATKVAARSTMDAGIGEPIDR